MRTTPSTPRRALLLGLALVPLAACHSGSGSSQPGFLESESQVDRGGMDDSRDPEIHADGKRIYVLYVDDRNGAEELFLNVSTDGGATWLAQDVRIPGDPNGPLGVDPSGRKLAFSGNDVVAVFEESDDMFANVSHDGGLSWKAQATRIDPGGINANDSDDPVVLHGQGSFYAVWRDEVNGLADVYFSSSTDLGETWSAAARVDTSPAGTAETDDLRMALSGTGEIYVSWADDRNDPGGQEDVFFQRSADGGMTWLGADVRVNAGAGSDIDGPRLAANGSTVYVAFRDDRTGDDGTYFQRSLDGGDTWLAMDVRLDATSAGIPIDDVVVAADGDLVVVGWKAQDPGPADDLHINISQDGGDTWLAAPLRMDQDAAGVGDADGIKIEVLGQTIVALWEDDRNGLDDVYMRYSKDAGVSWSDEHFVEETDLGSSDASRQRLALSADGAWAAWHDDRNGDLDVFVNGGALPDIP